MVSKEILDYIREQRSLGHSDEAIKAAFREVGYSEEALAEAMHAVDNPTPPPPPSAGLPPIPPVPQASQPEGVQQQFQETVVSTFPTFNELFNTSVDHYKRRFLPLVGIFILPTLISLIGSLVLDISSIISLSLIIIAAMFSIGSFLALLLAINDDNLGVFSAYGSAFKNLFSYFFVAGLQGSIVIGGLIMGIIPGIIFLFFFMFSVLVFVIEGDKGFSALFKSREYFRRLEKKHLWKLLGIGLGVVGATVIINFIGYFILHPTNFGGDIVSRLLNLIILPIGTLFYFHFFQAVRRQAPELNGQPINKKKGWWILTAIIGFGVGIVIILTSMWFTVVSGSGLKEQSKDSQRMSDITVLSTLVSTHIMDVDNPLKDCRYGVIYRSNEGSTAVDGTGWIPLDFTEISIGSPVSQLLTDPDDPTTYYTFACDPQAGTYEFNVHFSSERYTSYMSNDGGNNDEAYEIGSDLNLIK